MKTFYAEGSMRILACVVVALYGLSGWAHYDEVLDPLGRWRPAYEQVGPFLESKTIWEMKKFEHDSYWDFGTDNALLAIPRMMTYDDVRTLQQGVTQRALAIRAFLHDIASGQHSYRGVLPGGVAKRIGTRSHEWRLLLRMSPDQVNFWYGPDIIRGQDGGFYVLEDNLGYLGGMGDLTLAREIMLKRFPGLGEITESIDPEDFYRRLADSYQQRAGGGKVVVLQYPFHNTVDTESVRTDKIFARQGMERVFLPVNDGQNAYKKRLQVTSDGVYFTDGESWERVTLIVSNAEFQDLDPQHPLVRDRDSLIAETGVPGLFEAFFAGQVQIVNSPGAEFVGDKELYRYIDILVRHYLGEEPILRNLPTWSCATDSGQLDRNLLEGVNQDPQNYVIKKVDGRGGSEVWVGAKLNAGELRALLGQVAASPASYIVQRYEPLSRIDEYIVDLRLLADVSDVGVVTANIPWSRGLPMSGNGKVNLSDQGRELTVMVPRDNYTDQINAMGSDALQLRPSQLTPLNPDGRLTRSAARYLSDGDRSTYFAFHRSG